MADAKKPLDPDDIGESGPNFLLDHTDPTGTPRPDVWRQAVADFYQLDLDASVQWKQIGPAPLVVDGNKNYLGQGPDSGEVTDILIDPAGTTDKKIYITTDDGGIWKTLDGGSNWLPMTDQMFSISMGAVAMDPSNSDIIYGGSGNLFDGGSAFTKGAGIYRSPDGGLTWSIVDGGYFGTIFANTGINRIVCPVANCLLVATNKGLFRSVDGGCNFGANAPAFNDRNPIVAGKICSLFLDTAAPATVVYAGVAGDSVDVNKVALPIVGLLKSTDGGATFPTNLFSNPGAPALPYGSFVVVQSQFDGAAANSATLYASVQYTVPAAGNNPPTPTYVGLFRSTNSGANWTPLNNLKAVASGNGFSQTNYDLTLGVDPLNSLRVYAGFQQVWLSIDGGVNFQPTAITDSKVHWDNHALVFSPASHRGAAAPTRLYTGTDGGIATSGDGGLNWTPPINGSIATNLFRGIDIGKGSPNNAYTYGGCQDTGTSGHRPTDTGTQWHASINGDGWLIAVDPTDPKTVYGFDNEYFIKSSDEGANWLFSASTPVTIGAGLTNPKPSYARAIALEQTGTVPANRIVYVSEGSVLFKSTNAGLSFVKTNLTIPVYPPPNPPNLNFITCIVTTSASANLVWAGAFDGSVHCSLDGGATWDAAPLSTTPNGAVAVTGSVNHIAIDPTNTQRIAVVYGGVSGIHAKYQTRHVFLSLDGGASWHDVSGTDGNGPVGNLPDLPLRSVVFDAGVTPPTPPAIVVAGDSGVLRCIDSAVSGTGSKAVGSGTWKIYGTDLPMVCCNSLAIDNSPSLAGGTPVPPAVLRVGTYGRSCFEVTRPSGPTFTSDDNLAFGVVATGQSVTLPFYVYNCGDAAMDITAATILGPATFTLGAVPAIPVSIAPGATQVFQVTYAPTAPGDEICFVQMTCNDASQTNQLIPASGTGVSTALAPRLASNPISTVGFGTVAVGNFRTVDVQFFNVGTATLNITGISLSAANPNCVSTDFSLSPTPTFPIVIPPGGESDVTFKFKPSGTGPSCAAFFIASNDPQFLRGITTSGTGYQASSGFWNWLLTLLGLAHPINP